MTAKRITAAVAMAAAALVLGAVFGRPGNGRAAGTAPTNTALPAITGTAQVGQTLTAGDGTWTGSPTAYTYAWSSCDQYGANCSAISGATSKTYAPVAGDVGHTLRVTVTATNGSGSASATSSST